MRVVIQFQCPDDMMNALAIVAGWRVLMDPKRPAWGDIPVRWDDANIPRTSSPVRFVPRVVAPFGLRWGMVNKWALVSPSRIVS